MDFAVTSSALEKTKSDCIICPIHQDQPLSPAVEGINQATGNTIQQLIDRGDHSGAVGEVQWLHTPQGVSAQRTLLLGMGRDATPSDLNLKKSITAAATALRKSGCRNAHLPLLSLGATGSDPAPHRWSRLVVETFESTLYRYDLPGAQKKRRGPALRKITLALPDRAQMKRVRQAIAEGSAIAGGVSLARTLGNLPGNVCTPSYLASQARKIGRGEKSITIRVLSEKEMEKLGMGALLSVARGSDQPAKLIVAEYRGAPKKQQPIALVGKGVTFDSGGISLKPGAKMDEMKFDMCGAASVLGALQAVRDLNLPLNLVAIIPATENLPGGKATKPGDVVTSLSGQTIEILNTDAEGRLILCDALTYVERYKPAEIIDIATLTGACVVALGKHAAGLLSNDDQLANDLLQAGEQSSDRAWRLPLWDEYQPQLDSNFADMGNIGGPEAGTITAACFLSRFVEEQRWAHLDIAGAAWLQGKEKGATGRPVSLLVQHLLNRVADQGG